MRHLETKRLRVPPFCGTLRVQVLATTINKEPWIWPLRNYQGVKSTAYFEGGIDNGDTLYDDCTHGIDCSSGIVANPTASNRRNHLQHREEQHFCNQVHWLASTRSDIANAEQLVHEHCPLSHLVITKRRKGQYIAYGEYINAKIRRQLESSLTGCVVHMRVDN